MSHPLPVSEDEGAVASRSRWEVIAASLRDDIVSGVLAPGQRLPNETLLAQRFEVNRHTLRQAMQALVHEGFVCVRHGSGSYVRELVLDYALQRRTRMTENLAEAGERATRELLSAEDAPAGEWAAGLRVPARSLVRVLTMRAVVRGRPVGVSRAAFALPRFAGIDEAFVAHRGVTAALRHLGVSDYTRSRSQISARLPTALEADALARPASQPVLEVEYVNVDADRVPVQAGRTVFAADAVQLSVDLDGEGTA